MAATVQMTGRDRQYILLDLWDVAGLGDHIRSITVDAPGEGCDDRAYITLHADAHVLPLVVAHDHLDDPDTPTANSGVVHHGGLYRGVPVLFALDFVGDYVSGGPHYEDRKATATPLADAALADLLSAVDAGGAR